MRRKWIQNMRIHNKLMLSFLLICLVPLLAVSICIYNYSVRGLEEASQEFASIYNSQIVSSIDGFIEEFDRITKSVLVDPELISGIDQEKTQTINEQVNQQIYFRKVMMRIMTLKPEIKGISLLTPNHNLYQFSANGSSVNREELEKQGWLKEMKDSKDPLVITAVHDCSYYDNSQDGIVLTVGRRIYNYSGANAGVLLIDMEPSTLVELNDDFLLARNNYNIKISVTNAKEEILYDSDVAGGRITWEEAFRKDMLLHEKKPDNYMVMSHETKRGGLKVNAVIPKRSLLMKIDKMNYVTGAGIICSAILVVVVSYRISRTLTRPLKRLQKNMKQVEEGQYQSMLQGEAEDEIGSLIASYNHMITQIKTLIEDVYVAEIKQKNAKFLALQTQINPHMLYNTLESIRMKALVRGEDEIADMIKILSKMFRLALTDRKASHQIKDEIEYAEYYLKLQNMRFKDQFDLEVAVPEEIQEQPMIALVLQPIIENSMEHGIRSRGDRMHIRVEGILEENSIRIRIQDDGIGMTDEQVQEINKRISQIESSKCSSGTESDKCASQAKLDRHTSIGLRNIAERIKLQYGESSYLKVIANGEAGGLVEIRIPYSR